MGSVSQILPHVPEMFMRPRPVVLHDPALEAQAQKLAKDAVVEHLIYFMADFVDVAPTPEAIAERLEKAAAIFSEAAIGTYRAHLRHARRS